MAIIFLVFVIICMSPILHFSLLIIYAFVIISVFHSQLISYNVLRGSSLLMLRRQNATW